MNLLRAVDPKLYDLVQPYRVVSDAQMPLAYQNIPGGRPLHNDWGIMSDNPVLKFLQPWQKIPRMRCAYRLPLPFRISKGAKTQKYMPWSATYPLAPGVQLTPLAIEAADGSTVIVPHALVDVGSEGWATFEAFFPHLGEWREVFTQYRRVILGRELAYCRGVKPDLTVVPVDANTVKSDLMCWLPEIDLTFNKLPT